MNTAQESAYELAADWYLRLSECTPAEKASLHAAFQEWLDAEPGNVEAFARVSAIWDDLDHHAIAPEMMALRQAALEDVRIVAAARYRLPARAWRMMAVAAVLLILVASGAWIGASSYFAGESYATSIGERRTIALADGSRVDIDAGSKVQVEFEREIRLVRLHQGRAFFQVAEDAARPFIVEAAGRQVVATGTAFDVELLDRRMQVNLVEGQVVVRSAEARTAQLVPESAAQLSPGDQLTVLGTTSPVLVRKANVTNATSWRHGRLVFDDDPLPIAVARVQRYAQVEIVLADESLNTLHISGVFNEGDVAAFVGALEKYFGIRSDATRPSRILLSRSK